MWEFIVKKVFPRNPQKRGADVEEIHRVGDAAGAEPVDGAHWNESLADTGVGMKPETKREGGGRILICPVCSNYMGTERVGGIEIDRCDECGGIFLDRGELRILTGTEEPSLKEREGESLLIYTPEGLKR